MRVALVLRSAEVQLVFQDLCVRFTECHLLHPLIPLTPLQRSSLQKGERGLVEAITFGHLVVLPLGHQNGGLGVPPLALQRY